MHVIQNESCSIRNLTWIFVMRKFVNGQCFPARRPFLVGSPHNAMSVAPNAPRYETPTYVQSGCLFLFQSPRRQGNVQKKKKIGEGKKIGWGGGIGSKEIGVETKLNEGMVGRIESVERERIRLVSVETGHRRLRGLANSSLANQTAALLFIDFKERTFSIAVLATRPWGS